MHLDARGLDVDHVVPLAYAWSRGADAWSEAAREASADDPANLIPTEARVNHSKDLRGPLAWLPPDESAHYDYVLRFTRVAQAHGLHLPSEETSRIGALEAQVCRRTK